MRLRGSKAESDLRTEILDATRSLLDDRSRQGLLEALAARMAGFRTAHVLCVIPDQEDDVVLILVDGRTVVRIVRDRPSGRASVEWAIPREEYARTLKGRPSHLRLAVAIDLASASDSSRP